MRLINAAAVFFAMASAFLLYALNYEARQLQALVQQKERASDKARADIAVLRAERSYLTRPERIDPIARGLGLVPAEAGNFETTLTIAEEGKRTRH